MSDPAVTLTLTAAEREIQLAARDELRAACAGYLSSADRDPAVAEQVVLSVLEYLSGEESVGA